MIQKNSKSKELHFNRSIIALINIVVKKMSTVQFRLLYLTLPVPVGHKFVAGKFQNEFFKNLCTQYYI